MKKPPFQIFTINIMGKEYDIFHLLKMITEQLELIEQRYKEMYIILTHEG